MVAENGRVVLATDRSGPVFDDLADGRFIGCLQWRHSSLT